jgi:hypothetical protein
MPASKKPQEAKVDKYPERPLEDALADPSDIKKAENRPEKDQIEDYHEKHPTLKVPAAVEKATSEG